MWHTIKFKANVKSGGPIKKIDNKLYNLEKPIEQLDNRYGIQCAGSDCFWTLKYYVKLEQIYW